MMTLALYLLKVIACSGILFIYYQFALKNKAFHQWNRFYLLFAVCLSALLPLIQFTVDSTNEEPIQLIRAAQSADNYLEGIVISSDTPSSSTNWWLLLYCVIGCTLFFSILLSVYRIMRMIKKWDVQLVQNVKFLNTTEAGTPFSFLNYVFWNRDIPLQSEAGQTIFRHELVHVEEKHTWDKLFVQAVMAAFWCNPFFWLIKKELRFIHEFIADKKAVGQNGAAAFAAMILQSSFPKQYSSISNPFFQTSIKRRLAMLTKIQNPVLNYISRIVALPLIAITIFAFTVRTNSTENASNPSLKEITAATDTIPKSKEIKKINVGADKKVEILYSDGTSEKLTEQELKQREGVTNSLNKTGAKPVYYLDGKIVSEEELQKVAPNVIKSINVLKGQPAIDKYGEKAKDGAVEIKTKSEEKEVVVQGYPLNKKEVIVEGHPLENKEVANQEQSADKKEIVVIGHPLKKEAKEVVVEGYPLKKSEPVFTTAEQEASIDLVEWRKFLETEALPIVIKAANAGAHPGNYTVNVRFIVNTDGTISEPIALNDPGYGIASGIVTAVEKSPKWTPAKQNGKIVRSYHVQPVTFQISEQ